MKHQFTLHGVQVIVLQQLEFPGHFTGEKYAYMKRMEYRVPDPASNPYLVFSAVLAAGLDGIKKEDRTG